MKAKLPTRGVNRGLKTRHSVRMLKQWRGYNKGDVISPPASVRQIYIEEGIAELVQEEPIAQKKTEEIEAGGQDEEAGVESKQGKKRKKQSDQG